MLLLATPSSTFNVIIPWLLLFATLAFAFGGRIGAALNRHIRIGSSVMLPIQFVLAIYGGYFGGAVGIMMMAVWSLLGRDRPEGGEPGQDTPGRRGQCHRRAVLHRGRRRLVEATAIMLVAACIGGYAGAASRAISTRG